MMRRAGAKRGVVLIAALFLLLFMAILATNLFYMKMTEHRAGVLHEEEMQAWQAAEAGLEDAKVKLMKDALWPVISAHQKVYLYSETLGFGTFAHASYRVAIRRNTDGTEVITSWGLMGNPTSPTAQRQVQAVFDPKTAKFTTFVDWGSF